MFFTGSDGKSDDVGTCSGTLITQNFVLSAAHCFTFYVPTGYSTIDSTDRVTIFNNMYLPTQFWFGLHSYKEYDDFHKGKKDWKNYNHVQLVKVSDTNNFHFHPNWALSETTRKETKSQWSDVVLVKMPVKITKQTPQAIFAPAQIDWYKGSYERE